MFNQGTLWLNNISLEAGIRSFLPLCMERIGPFSHFESARLMDIKTFSAILYDIRARTQRPSYMLVFVCSLQFSFSRFYYRILYIIYVAWSFIDVQTQFIIFILASHILASQLPFYQVIMTVYTFLHKSLMYTRSKGKIWLNNIEDQIDLAGKHVLSIE